MINTAGANTSEIISSFWLRIAWLAALLAVLVLLFTNLIYGNLNQDEGWYLYAAKLIAAGKMPYRDFAFTQGPAMAFVYSLVGHAVQWGGLAAGRFFTAALGLIGALIAALLASRLARPNQRHLAALLCFTLLLVNVYQAYFCTVIKTYSLTILFVTSALLTLHYALARRNWLATMLSALLLVAAAGTRSSAAIIAPIILVLLWLDRKSLAFPGWIYFMLGGIIAALIVFGPFLFICPGNFIYFVVRYHTLRQEDNLLAAIMFKAGFISRVLQAYFVCFALWLAALAAKRIQQNSPDSSPRPGSAASSLLRRLLWIGGAAVTIVHFFAPFPYDDYQVFVYPLFAIAVALMILDAFPERAGKWILPVVLCLSLASAISSPLNQELFVEGRELIWWHLKDKPPLIKLRQTAAQIRALGQPNDILLTQDPYLAVESGRILPHGLEMGQFSYFPDLTREQALKLNVLNRDLFAELIQKCDAPLAALSGYAFAMRAPHITPTTSTDKLFFTAIISNRYELLTTVPNFGQAATELRLYKIKSSPKPEI